VDQKTLQAKLEALYAVWKATLQFTEEEANPNNSSDCPKSAQATKQLGHRFHCKQLHQTAHSHSCKRYQRFGFDRAFLVNNAG